MSKTHVMVFPMPVQGHINPMLQFSKKLASKGLMVTFVATTSSMSKSSHINTGSVNVEIISDNSGGAVGNADSVSGFMGEFKAVVSRNLSRLICEKKNSQFPPKVLLYDSVLPWIMDIVHEHDLLSATFFTQASSVCSVIYHLHKGSVKIPIEGDIVKLPGLPELGPNDVPLFEFNGLKNHSFMSFMTNQFSNTGEVNWVFFNTFDKLEEEALSWMKSQFRFKTVGPTIPAININTSSEDESGYGLNLFKQNVDSYMKWLATKAKASVIYISFGSLASVGDEQMEEIARGLKNSGHYFLWVVRTSEENKLPNNLKEEMLEKGLIVNWCTQIEVLAHNSVGCFMTHCGWNSTMEALTLGVPMIAMPQWSDQPTNAKCITDVWYVGVRLKANEDGIIPGDEILSCIKEVMEGERGNMFRRNASKWKELAIEAISKGGSSDHNIDEFVSEVMCT